MNEMALTGQKLFIPKTEKITESKVYFDGQLIMEDSKIDYGKIRKLIKK